MADALAAWGAPFPETLAEAREFAAGPLDHLLRARGLDEEAAEIRERMARLLAHAHQQDEIEDEPTMRLPRGSLAPIAANRVRVMVVGSGALLADALRDAPAGDRMAVLPVMTEAALAGALHASGPLVVIVDAATATLTDASLASTLCARDTRMTVIVTSAELPRGQRYLVALGRVGVKAIAIEQPRHHADIIGDLVLICGNAA